MLPLLDDADRFFVFTMVCVELAGRGRCCGNAGEWVCNAGNGECIIVIAVSPLEEEDDRVRENHPTLDGSCRDESKLVGDGTTTDVLVVVFWSNTGANRRFSCEGLCCPLFRFEM